MRKTLAGLGLALVLGVAACGGSEGASDPAGLKKELRDYTVKNNLLTPDQADCVVANLNVSLDDLKRMKAGDQPSAEGEKIFADAVTSCLMKGSGSTDTSNG